MVEVKNKKTGRSYIIENDQWESMKQKNDEGRIISEKFDFIKEVKQRKITDLPIEVVERKQSVKKVVEKPKVEEVRLNEDIL